MQKLVLVASAAMLAGLVRVGDGLAFGSCPNQELIKQFDEENFAGIWYEFGKYKFLEFQACVVVSLSVSPTVINMKTTYRSFWTKREFDAELEHAVSGATDSHYIMTKDSERTAEYKILATDYTSYAIVWRCGFGLFLNFQGVQVLTREREPDDSVIEEIKTQMKRRDLSRFALSRTRQNRCD